MKVRVDWIMKPLTGGNERMDVRLVTLGVSSPDEGVGEIVLDTIGKGWLMELAPIQSGRLAFGGRPLSAVDSPRFHVALTPGKADRPFLDFEIDGKYFIQDDVGSWHLEADVLPGVRR